MPGNGDAGAPGLPILEPRAVPHGRDVLQLVRSGVRIVPRIENQVYRRGVTASGLRAPVEHVRALHAGQFQYLYGVPVRADCARNLARIERRAAH